MTSIGDLFNHFMSLIGLNYYNKTESDGKYALKTDIPSGLTVDSSLSGSSENPVQNKVIKSALDGKASSNHSHTVSNISDFPDIPSKTSDLVNDSDFVTTSDSRLSDSRTPTSHNHGNLSNDGKLGSASGKIVTTTTGGTITASDSISKSMISDFPSTMAPSSHTHASSDVKEASALSNIGSSANATQHTVNDNINTKLGQKANSSDVYTKSETYTQSEITTLIANAVAELDLFEVVNSLPSSNIKDNRLYLIVNEENITNNAYDIYLRVNNSWERLDALEFDISNFYTKSEVDTLLGGKVDTSDSRLTNARTPTSHSHGDITNTGTLGSTANKPLITSTNGKIATGSFGSSANTFCEGNDSRLSDARTPTSHSHTKSEISDFPSTMTPSSHTHGNVQNDGTVKVSNTVQKSKNLVTDANGYVNVEDKITKTSQLTNDGDGSNAFIKENDSRLTNARTPSSHTHGNITNDGKVGTTASLPLITTTGGAVTTGSFGSSAGTFCQGNDSRLSDARTPTSHAHGNITNAGAIGSTANLPVITTTSGKLTTGSFGTTANTFCQGNDSRLSNARTPTSHTHGSLENGGTLNSDITSVNKIAVTDSSNNLKTISQLPYSKISGTPSIPSASSTTPGADTSSGSVGTGTTWAKADHTHPKSSLYAEASHIHSLDDMQLYTPITGRPVISYDSLGYIYVLDDTIYVNTDEDDIPYLAYNDSPVASLADISGKVNVSDVKDNLTSTDTNKPLSANQGKELKTLVDNLSSAITNLEIAEVVSSLPTSNIKTNKLYFVANSVNAGNNKYDIYLRVGSAWEKIDSLDFSISDYIKKSSTNGLVKNDGSIDTNTYLTTGTASNTYQVKGNYLTSHQDISGKENTSNKVTSWSTTTTNDHYPSETLVKTSLDAKLNTTDLETELESILDTLITEAQS